MGPRHFRRGYDRDREGAHHDDMSSMGPRHFRRGNKQLIVDPRPLTVASMGPRHLRRGYLQIIYSVDEWVAASMGPRHFRRGIRIHQNYSNIPKSVGTNLVHSDIRIQGRSAPSPEPQIQFQIHSRDVGLASRFQTPVLF